LDLLGALGSAKAVPRIIELIRVCDITDWAYDQAVRALRAIGAPAFEPCLSAHESTSDQDFRDTIAHLLAELPVRDERVYRILVALFARDPIFGADSLATYGDPQAIDLLRHVLDTHQIVSPAAGELANQEVIEC